MESVVSDAFNSWLFMRDLAECRATRATIVLLVLACSLTGCAPLGRRDATPCALWRWSPASTPLADDADRCFQHAAHLESAADQGCVDWYFAAARLAWRAACGSQEGRKYAATAWGQYNHCLAALLDSAGKSGRLDATQGLVIREGDQTVTIPVVHDGFPWTADDFQRLIAPPTGREPLLRRRYSCPGIGVPLVIERSRIDQSPLEARFYPEKSPFSATALLRFDEFGAGVLEFHNPLDCQSLDVAHAALPIASDLTAPLAWALRETPRSYLAGFIQPGQATTSARLNFLEPYQPGKIPVVIIHGLFSDPQSCSDLINDLRGSPGFNQAHQLWVYRYPTGQGFLRSAASLREELSAVLAALDPQCADPAIRRMVLVGHSMGGLIAKLQVTYSEDRIWRRVANRPLEEIVTTEATRAELARTCFFDPSPHVARVIFIASPHQGALPSSDLIGKGAALLVEPSPEQAAMHQQLIADNPQTFDPRIERRFPTSIDLLAPDSPLLAAMRQMRIGAGVELHNIIGVSHPLSLDGPSDGIVSVHSARHPGCRSVLAVGAPHAQVQRSPEASAEVLRILNQP